MNRIKAAAVAVLAMVCIIFAGLKWLYEHADKEEKND